MPAEMHRCKTATNSSFAPLKKPDHARLVAQMLQRMTGDECEVTHGSNRNYIARYEAGGKRVRG